MHDHRAFGPIRPDAGTQQHHGGRAGRYDEPWPPHSTSWPPPYTPPHSHRKPGRLARLMRLLGR